MMLNDAVLSAMAAMHIPVILWVQDVINTDTFYSTAQSQLEWRTRQIPLRPNITSNTGGETNANGVGSFFGKSLGFLNEKKEALVDRALKKGHMLDLVKMAEDEQRKGK